MAIRDASYSIGAEIGADVDLVTDSSDRRPKAVALSYCIGYRIGLTRRSSLSYVIAFMSSQSAWWLLRRRNNTSISISEMAAMRALGS